MKIIRNGYQTYQVMFTCLQGNRPVPFSLILLLIFLGCEVNAQHQYFFYYGKTIDQAGKEPLSNVNLSITGSRIGTVSGKQGDFSFFIDSLP
ncbi:MAG: carboxypeptidase-like regulatory domain-containing protein, partial [Bacteroidales bacterium]|nr:carboxypeptidase-like regulatory domain-containing protein [Bacteroidales bacterium]